jgi:hypothetical protein
MDGERPLPDYDGREAPPSAGEVALWVPRVALFPLYLVSEFLIRRPLGFLITAAEKNDIPALAIDLFTFDEHRKIGLLPTAFIDFGFRPSIGLYYFHNDFLTENNDFRAQVSWGGKNWLYTRVADRIYPTDEQELGVRAIFWKRPDWIFHGTGPDSLESSLGRYSSTSFAAQLYYEAQLWRSSQLSSHVGFKDVGFSAGVGCCEDPTVQRRIELEAYPEPVGLDDGYRIAEIAAELALDTRKRRDQDPPVDGSDFVSPPGSGVRFATRGRVAQGLDDRRAFADSPEQTYQWVNYGASLGGFVDLTESQRVLGLSLIADFSDPIGDSAAIPFTEQTTLGGFRPMRGFLENRLIDRSSLVGRFEYSWPVWVWLDGTLQYDVGNVFGEHLRDFEFDRLRSSIGMGLRGTASRDHAFELLVALGTQTFEQGHSVDSIRLAFGATSGF